MVSTPLDVPVVRAAGERRLYTWAALTAVLFVFAGFAPTYYLKGVYGAPDLTTLKHVHGIVMTAWFALFLVQVRLVATGRTAVHRKLGLVGILLALLVVTVGMATAITSVRSGASPIGVPPLVFLVLPVGEMVVFATLFTAAIVLRKRSAYHKRLMLLASIAMLTPATGPKLNDCAAASSAATSVAATAATANSLRIVSSFVCWCPGRRTHPA